MNANLTRFYSWSKSSFKNRLEAIWLNREVVLQSWAPKDLHCDPAFRGTNGLAMTVYMP